MDVQMVFYDFFHISYQKLEIWERLFFTLCSRPPSVMNYWRWPRNVKEKWSILNFYFLVRNMKKIIKYHLNIYKKYMLDQTLEGVPQKLRLPCPSEVQNWKGRGRLNFWARALKFFAVTYLLKIFKWYLHHFFISVIICHLPKSWKAYYSRSCVFHALYNSCITPSSCF